MTSSNVTKNTGKRVYYTLSVQFQPISDKTTGWMVCVEDPGLPRKNKYQFKTEYEARRAYYGLMGRTGRCKILKYRIHKITDEVVEENEVA